jgi:hypothetical protein
MKPIDASPKASSHLKTLQRVGHTLNTAIADIIDNSITAKATVIKIFFDPFDANLKILDNGIGMSKHELLDNMIIGCKDPMKKREKYDLGRFGSGMKMASFSQSHKLTVITRKQGSDIHGILYDIDEIYQTDRWQMNELEKNELPASTFDQTITSGTAVIWENLIKYRDKDIKFIENEMGVDAKNLFDHLALHFHKFLEGPHAIKILINNIEVHPIDPFFRGSKGYQEGPTENAFSSGGKIIVKTHIIPHHDYMSKSEIERNGGLEKIAEGQGIYVYRERRLIFYGGWMGLKPRFQVAKLARVEVEVPASLDHEWSTDVKKSQMQFPSKAKRMIKKLISQPIKRSTDEFRYRGKKEENNKFWFLTNNERTDDLTYIVDTKNSQLNSIINDLAKEKKLEILGYLKELSRSLPLHSIHEKMSINGKQMRQDDEDNLNDIFKIIDELRRKN